MRGSSILPETLICTQAFWSAPESFKDIRPESRVITSIFNLFLEIAAAMLDSCSADNRRPKRVIIRRSFPLWSDQLSYWSSWIGENRICMPNLWASNRRSFSIEEDLNSVGISIRIPRDRYSWITACPMSRIVTWYRARMLVKLAVRPGLSLPLTLIVVMSRVLTYLRIITKLAHSW